MNAASAPIPLLLADDHNLVRAGIRSLLGEMPGVTVVAEASNGQEALCLAEAFRPRIAVIDIAMPGLNGLETTERLLKLNPKLRVVILSMHANPEYVYQAFEAGAVGYLLKKSAVAELEAAIRTVSSGKTYLSPELGLGSAENLLSRSRPRHASRPSLTVRQQEILRLIAQSRTTKEIAVELGVSAKTVEFHRAQLMKRLGIFDVPGLVRHAMSLGLTEG